MCFGAGLGVLECWRAVRSVRGVGGSRLGVERPWGRVRGVVGCEGCRERSRSG